MNNNRVSVVDDNGDNNIIITHACIALNDNRVTISIKKCMLLPPSSVYTLIDCISLSSRDNGDDNKQHIGVRTHVQTQSFGRIHEY